jgi:hypothetical protein
MSYSNPNFFIYKEILEHATSCLDKYNNIRSNYPLILSTADEKRNGFCPWCTQGKRSDFAISDLDLTDSDWCRFCIECSIKNPESSGIEPSLIGEYFEQIRSLNKYIITTSSTNDPYNPEFQPMFIMFYTTYDISRRIISYIKQLDEYYQYLLYNSNMGICKSKISNNYTKLFDTAPTLVEEYLDEYNTTGSITHDYFSNKYNDYIHTNYTLVIIEDANQRRRTLYSILLSFFTRNLPLGM